MFSQKYLFNHWQVAYRMKDEKLFTLLPNPKWGWAADPFPVRFQGSLYIFAEIFLYKSERNGIIAYCKWENGMFTDWVVSMDKHWHLSYPNVFVENGRLYMCPESRQNDEIAVYELKAFPDQWVKVKVLAANVQCADTTFCRYHGEYFMFTFCPVRAGSVGALYLYRIDENGVFEPRIISEDAGSARPGGRIIYKKDKVYRVSQNGLQGYGTGLVFSEIDAVAPVYKEHKIKSITPKHIRGNWKRKFIGIHTYNRAEEIEVIDLKYQTFSAAEYLARKRVRKVFQNKYS